MALKTGQTTNQVWRQHVEAFKKSGLTRPAYCRKHHIQVSRLDYWRRIAGIKKKIAAFS